MTSKDASPQDPSPQGHSRPDYIFNTNPLNPFDGLHEGATHEVRDLVRLELAAEDMIDRERALLGAYLAEDAGRVSDFWHEFKEEALMLEYEVGEWLLTAADPSRVEWQREHWLDTDENTYLH